MPNVIPIPRRSSAEFAPGDCVRLADGREGIVRRRQFRHDRAEVQDYEILLTGGRGRVWVNPAKVSRWFPEAQTAGACA